VAKVMQINEVCKQTGLTKKAIEYYQAKGLVFPVTKENGYREFTEADLCNLNTIAMLRKLGLNIDQIKQVVESKDKDSALMTIKQEMQIKAKAALARTDLIEQLVRGKSMEDIQRKLDLLEQQITIKEKLLMAFPGYIGRYLSLHFGQFLNAPIKTDEQKRMYDIIIDFLDNMESIEIPEEIKPLFEEVDSGMDDERLEMMSMNMQDAFKDFESYWESNKESIIKYSEFKKSNEYPNSIMAKFMNLFRTFGETSGYYEVFIPAMRKLSPEYNDYYDNMLKANEKLLQKLPDNGIGLL